MIVTKYGNLLDAKGVIVHGCNAQGVMGSGVAKQIKDKWPEAFKTYTKNLTEWRKASRSSLGTATLIEVGHEVWVVNAITQENYGRDKNQLYVDYGAVRACFNLLNEWLPKIQYKLKDLPVNFPLIGCGLANGDWEIVSKIIDEELDDSFEKVLWLREE